MGFASKRAVVVAFLVLTASECRAQSTSGTAAAQGLFDEAKALIAAGKLVEACPKLEESQRLAPASGTLMNLAKCYEKTGRLASAWSTYLEAAGSARGSGNPERERSARDAAAALAPRVARLRLNVPAESRVDALEVTKDGAPMGSAQWGVALPEDAGEHRIVASAPGYDEWSTTVKVEGEGTTRDVTVPKLLQATTAPEAPKPLDVRPDAGSLEPRPSGLGAQRVVALVAGGVGVVGLAVGGVFGLKAMSKKKDADDGCAGTACSTDGTAAAGNDAHSAGNVATVGMIVGAVGLVAGVTLWVTAPRNEPTTELVLGPSAIQFRGTW